MILVTGTAGFIGFFTAKTLLQRGEQVIGVDNLNDYYDLELKKARLEQLEKKSGFTFVKADIADHGALTAVMDEHSAIDRIVHLAAQPGVRYSLTNPFAYGNSNLMGHLTMLEIARHKEGLKHFVYASSSSVYGANTKQPFSETDPVCEPISLYAATKRSCELMSQSYAHLYDIPSTGLRFFTVYGPWGRPDMAYFSFTRDILEGNAIEIHNRGDMRRDFTWIDDCVAGILGALDHPPQKQDKYCIGDAPHRLFNIGNNKPEKLLDFVELIEKELNCPAEKSLIAQVPGNVKETYADIDAAKDIFGYEPNTPLSEGIPKFVEWYKSYYGIKQAA